MSGFIINNKNTENSHFVLDPAYNPHRGHNIGGDFMKQVNSCRQASFGITVTEPVILKMFHNNLKTKKNN